MSFQLGNRDENGVLIGSFDQRGAFPIDILHDIVPFLYPCQECQSLRFHVVGEQPAGAFIKIAFMRKPLVSTGKNYTAICNSCTNINTVLPADVVSKLREGVIAPQICAMYATVCDPPYPYTDGYMEHFTSLHSAAPEKVLAFGRRCLKAYRREVKRSKRSGSPPASQAIVPTEPPIAQPAADKVRTGETRRAHHVAGTCILAAVGLAILIAAAILLSRPTDPAGTRRALKIEEGKARTKVYGIEAEGHRFVYVFDRSASMGGVGGSGSPLNSAKAELIASLEDLGDTNQFQIIFCNERPTLMKLSDQSEGLVFGNEQNKELARRFVRGITAEGGTSHEEALELALNLRPDVVFFLTDGQGEVWLGQLDRIRRRNGGRISIHTIELGLGPSLKRDNFPIRLARQNNGKYVYIDISQRTTMNRAVTPKSVWNNSAGKLPCPFRYSFS